MESKLLSNGIALGGVWKDFHDKMKELEIENEELKTINSDLINSRTILQQDHDNILEQFRLSASTLTREKSSHLEALDILGQANNDKELLEKRCANFERQCMKQSAIIDQLEKENNDLSSSLSFWQAKFSGADNLVREEKDENTILSDLIMKRDEQIEKLKTINTNKDNENNILKRSLQGKEKQLISICRDRDRLKDQIETYNKVMLPSQRATLSSSSNRTNIMRPGDIIVDDIVDNYDVGDDERDTGEVEAVMRVPLGPKKSGSCSSSSRKKNGLTVDENSKNLASQKNKGYSSIRGGIRSNSFYNNNSINDIDSNNSNDNNDNNNNSNRGSSSDTNKAVFDFDGFGVGRSKFSMKERQYQAVIRKLRGDLKSQPPSSFSKGKAAEKSVKG